MNIRVQYLEEVKTMPAKKDWKIIQDTGWRNDVIFSVHNDDIPTFAIKRLNLWIRWIEDIYSNRNGNLYKISLSFI